MHISGDRAHQSYENDWLNDVILHVANYKLTFLV